MLLGGLPGRIGGRHRRCGGVYGDVAARIGSKPAVDLQKPLSPGVLVYCHRVCKTTSMYVMTADTAADAQDRSAR